MQNTPERASGTFQGFSVSMTRDGRDFLVAVEQPLELTLSSPPELVQHVPDHHDEDRQSINAARNKAHRRGFRKIPCGNRDLVDATVGIDKLRDDLLIENELVRIH